MEPSNFSLQFSDYLALISGALSLFAIIVSCLVAHSQNALTRREQLFPFVTEILDEFHRSEFKRLLAYVKEDLAHERPPSSDGDAALTPADHDKLRPLMSYFNEVGLLVANGAIPAKLVASIMGGSVAASWKVLAPHIYARRVQRGDDPNYYAYYEHLAARMKEIGPQRLEGQLKLKKLPPVPNV